MNMLARLPRESRDQDSDVLVLNLPFPPSLNNLFVNVRGKGRVPSVRYKNWRERATQAMWGQRMIAFSGPVEIHIVYEDAGQADLDNLSKGLIDHLVHHRLIYDDSRKIVRKVTLEWGHVKGAVVTVTKI